MKSRFMRFTALLICVVVMLSLVVGCGSSSGTKTEETKAASAAQASTETKAEASAEAKKEVTLKLLISKNVSMEGFNAEFAAMKEKLGINTEVEQIPDSSEGENIIRTRIATNEMPDILSFNSGALLLTLDPEENFVDIANEPFMANVDEAYKKSVSSNGKVFGIPEEPFMVGAILYNKKVYADLGLQVPTTWKDFVANCEKIKEAGKTAVIGSYKTDWTAQNLLLTNFYNVLKAVPDFPEKYTANKAHYADTPAALRGFEKISEVKAKGFMNKDFLAVDLDGAQKMLVEGSGVHWPQLTFILANISEKYGDKVNDIGIFPTPSDDPNVNGFTVWMPASFYLTKACKDQDSAKKWMTFMVSNEGLALYGSKQKIYGPFAVKGANVPEGTLDIVNDMVKYVNEGKTSPALEFLTPVKGPNLPQICVECGSGIKTAQEAAQEADKDTEKQAKQLKLPGW